MTSLKKGVLLIVGGAIACSSRRNALTSGGISLKFIKARPAFGSKWSTVPMSFLDSTFFSGVIHELDRLLWEERDTFLMVVGERELQHARQQHGSPRSHWWYLDKLKTQPQPLQEQRSQLTKAFVPTFQPSTPD